MAKQARSLEPTPAALFGVVRQIPWNAPRVVIDELGLWEAKLERLRQRPAFAKACAETARAVSTRISAIDWTVIPAADLGACMEAMFLATQASEQFLPFLLDLDSRRRRQLYAGGWLVHCWERGVAPEPILALLVMAFEGGPPAMGELFRRAEAHPGSFAVGAVRLLKESGDEPALALAIKTVRQLAWRWVPSGLKARARDSDAADQRATLSRGRREKEPDAFRDLCGELDAAILTVMQERIGTASPFEAAFLGLDGHLANIPGRAANRLRGEPARRLARSQYVALDSAPGDLVIEIEPRPEATTPLDFAEAALLLREIEARGIGSSAAWESLTTARTDEAIARERRTSTKTLQREREALRAALDRLR